MCWDANLLPDQRIATCETGCHLCLLAGPGTGKTLVLCRRILYIIQEANVIPSQVLALTFTRAAAHELRQRVAGELGLDNRELPQISTLHSFSLRQLLQNAAIVATVPRPLRIADDWEERYIIEEDLKRILGIDIRDVRAKFNQLSSDWQTLAADADAWDIAYPDPAFLGAWRKHRETYGYTLRSELVYQLKKALEQNPDFTLEQSYKHILVDEYQDLNRCDLSVVKRLTAPGGQLFATGDDDQSIYGFRFAHPLGIRMFSQDYDPSKVLELEYCKRCDKRILDLGLFVANLDPERIPKPLKPWPGADEGEVRVLWFDDQEEEANTIAGICRYLMHARDYEPQNVLVLVRSDRHGVFSETLCQALERHGVPVACRVEVPSPLDQRDGRELLAILHLCINPKDHLAWRTLLQVRQNSVGENTIWSVYELALKEGLTFADALQRIQDSAECLPKLRNRLCRELETLNSLIAQFDIKSLEPDELPEKLFGVVDNIVPSEESRSEIVAYLQEILETSEAGTLEGLLSAMSASLGDKEQEIDHDSVNILTMHKAKGLTADAVFLVGAEDEYIPGDQLGEKEGDERRLLFVSLTRAKHTLFVTYCRRRTGRQRWTGRNAGKVRRTLSRFLVDAPITPESGRTYLESLK